MRHLIGCAAIISSWLIFAVIIYAAVELSRAISALGGIR